MTHTEDRHSEQPDFTLESIDEGLLEEDDETQVAEEADDVADAPHDFLKPEVTEECKQQVEPAQAIAALFDSMFPQKRSLLALMEACSTPQAYDRVEELVGGLTASRRTVYTTDNYLNMLVDAQALEILDEQGDPYVQREVEPVEVERDGVTYLEVAQPPEPFWHLTQAGAEYLEAHKAAHEIERLFGKRAELLEDFRIVMEMCVEAGGASIASLKEAVNDRPEMLEKKKTAQFLIDYLTDAGAVRYDGGWKLTEDGMRALEALQTQKG